MLPFPTNHINSKVKFTFTFESGKDLWPLVVKVLNLLTVAKSLKKKYLGQWGKIKWDRKIDMCDAAHPMGFKLHTDDFLNSSGLFNQSKVSLPKLSHQQVFLPSAADYQRTRTVHALHQIHQFLLHNFCWEAEKSNVWWYQANPDRLLKFEQKPCHRLNIMTS